VKLLIENWRKFINEELENVLDEQAPGSQIFEPGSSDELDRRGSYIGSDIQPGETSEPSAFAADVVKNLSGEDIALALTLEGVRIYAEKEGSFHKPYEKYAKLGAEPPPPPYVRLYHPARGGFQARGDRQHMFNYLRMLGLVKDGKPQLPKEVHTIGEPVRSSDTGLEAKVLKASWGENLPNEAYMNGNFPQLAKQGDVKPYSVKHPVSGETFTFTPMLSTSGLVHSVKIG
tara:strand:+ start:298 stop:990 length:693 start_codon:yes stop_codon:yes gene_type:complete